MVGVADYLDFYADDPATAVALAYVEGIPTAGVLERLRSVAARKPVVLVKGGATAGGQRAAASHTGSLATDDRVFDGHVPPGRRHPGATVEEAFEAAATFATQPLPRATGWSC
jgi:acyl-CoA synthetase (NDP forming)